MSIELTTAEQALLNRIGATLSPPVLSELPEADASKAGELFYLKGTLWTYSKAGQFGTLAEGTPWPVKGYKEWSGEVTAIATDEWSATPKKDETGIGSMSFANAGSGFVYTSLEQGIFDNAVVRFVDALYEVSLIDGILSVSLTKEGASSILRVVLNNTGSQLGSFLSTLPLSIKLYPPTT